MAVFSLLIVQLAATASRAALRTVASRRPLTRRLLTRDSAPARRTDKCGIRDLHVNPELPGVHRNIVGRLLTAEVCSLRLTFFMIIKGERLFCAPENCRSISAKVAGWPNSTVLLYIRWETIFPGPGAGTRAAPCRRGGGVIHGQQPCPSEETDGGARPHGCGGICPASSGRGGYLPPLRATPATRRVAWSGVVPGQAPVS